MNAVSAVAMVVPSRSSVSVVSNAIASIAKINGAPK
jgi:hypothetical protein